jgi:hypothetical protein
MTLANTFTIDVDQHRGNVRQWRWKQFRLYLALFNVACQVPPSKDASLTLDPYSEA